MPPPLGTSHVPQGRRHPCLLATCPRASHGGHAGCPAEGEGRLSSWAVRCGGAACVPEPPSAHPRPPTAAEDGASATVSYAVGGGDEGGVRMMVMTMTIEVTMVMMKVDYERLRTL